MTGEWCWSPAPEEVSSAVPSQGEVWRGGGVVPRRRRLGAWRGFPRLAGRGDLPAAAADRCPHALRWQPGTSVRAVLLENVFVFVWCVPSPAEQRGAAAGRRRGAAAEAGPRGGGRSLRRPCQVPALARQGRRGSAKAVQGLPSCFLQCFGATAVRSEH